MNLNLADQVALVAGSSRGIGKATASALLAEGCRVAITGRDPASLAATAREFETEFPADRIMACEGDLTQPEVIRDVLARVRRRWAKIDALICNIGTGRGKPGWSLEPADWTSLFEMNFWATVRLVTEVLPEMTDARQGSIVLVASIVGVESTPAPLPYSAAKAALINLSKNLARQAGPHNVRVNCVAPGNILFPGGSWEKHLETRAEEVHRFIQTEVPLRRFGRPEEIADAIAFLCSDRSSFITGACIVADGGQTRSL